MEYIFKLEPHNVKDTISINKARTTILLLTKPLGDIAKFIDENVKACEIRKKKIFEWEGDIRDLEKELYIPTINLISTQLDKLMTRHDKKLEPNFLK